MANKSTYAPQWGGFQTHGSLVKEPVSHAQTQDRRCSICMRSNGPATFSPCVNGCRFRTHQQCFDRWKGSSATGTCPVCQHCIVDRPDVQIIFPVGTRVILGGGQDAPLVTVVGFTVGGVRREYTVATSTGILSQTMPSTLAHMPMCRVCGCGGQTLEFNACNCRGSLLQFVHKKCLRHGERCGICDRTMDGSWEMSDPSKEEQSAWTRLKGVLGFQ